MYTKTITPAFEKIGKRKKMIGYTGEIHDGEECIHSRRYETQHAAEVALDALVFDLMRSNPQAEAEPASTCCFCSKPHHPQSCSEMRALLFAPSYADELKMLERDAREQGEADYKHCATCGGDGDCPDCGRCGTCKGAGRIPAYGYGDQAGGYAETCEDCKGKGVMPPLDVDFAPVGFEV